MKTNARYRMLQVVEYQPVCETDSQPPIADGASSMVQGRQPLAAGSETAGRPLQRDKDFASNQEGHE